MYRVKDKLAGVQYRQILKTHLAPYLAQFEKENKCEAIFQHDNDPKDTQKWLRSISRTKKCCPRLAKPKSWHEPDWARLENRQAKIFSRIDHATKLDQAFEIAKEEWNKLDLSYFQNLIKSMPRRIEAVYQARGRHTKY